MEFGLDTFSFTGAERWDGRKGGCGQRYELGLQNLNMAHVTLTTNVGAVCQSLG